MRLLLTVAFLLMAGILNAAVTVKNGANSFHWEEKNDVYVDAEGFLHVGDDRVKLKQADTEITCDGNVVIEDLCVINPLDELDVSTYTTTVNAALATINQHCRNITIPDPIIMPPYCCIVVLPPIPRTYYVEGQFYWNDYYYGFIYIPNDSSWYYSFDHGWFYPAEFSPAGHFSFFPEEGWRFIMNPPSQPQYINHLPVIRPTPAPNTPPPHP